jgi:hypothetical protein
VSYTCEVCTANSIVHFLTTRLLFCDPAPTVYRIGGLTLFAIAWPAVTYQSGCVRPNTKNQVHTCRQVALNDRDDKVLGDRPGVGSIDNTIETNRPLPSMFASDPTAAIVFLPRR